MTLPALTSDQLGSPVVSKGIVVGFPNRFRQFGKIPDQLQVRSKRVRFDRLGDVTNHLIPMPDRAVPIFGQERNLTELIVK
jgi:hypothetical protein